MFYVTIYLGLNLQPFTRNGHVFVSKGMINNHYGQPTNQQTNRTTKHAKYIKLMQKSSKLIENNYMWQRCIFVHDMISFKIIPKATNSLPKVCYMLTYLFTNLVINYIQNGIIQYLRSAVQILLCRVINMVINIASPFLC